MGTILSGLFMLIILPLILVAIAIAVMLGIGWLLTTFLPFTLFEATLISIFVFIPTVWLYYRVFGAVVGLPDLGSTLDWDEDEDEYWDDPDDWDDEPPKAYVVSPSTDTRKSNKRGRRGKKK